MARERINGLHNLLSMNGWSFPLAKDGKIYTKFEAKEVEINQHIPHGISYSLTLHDKDHALTANSTRIFGLDNAHGGKFTNNKYIGRRLEWDHKHNFNRVTFYEFVDCEQLLKDYWDSVKSILSSVYGIDIP